jgi:hypothetical protein
MRTLTFRHDYEQVAQKGPSDDSISHEMTNVQNRARCIFLLQTRQAKYVQRNTEERSRDHSCRGKQQVF